MKQINNSEVTFWQSTYIASDRTVIVSSSRRSKHATCRIVLQVNAHRLTSRISDMTSYFQEDGNLAYRLPGSSSPASSPSACCVIASLQALQYIVYFACFPRCLQVLIAKSSPHQPSTECRMWIFNWISTVRGVAVKASDELPRCVIQ